MKNKNPLEQVISLGEACRLWKRDRKAIIWQYWNGYIDMRKSGYIWLVDVDSMYGVYGEPVEKFIPDVG